MEQESKMEKPVAGTNEKEFKETIKEDNLGAKIVFKKGTNGSSISVDGHFSYNNRLYLVEIDSANEAKLVVGQYCLINALFDFSRNEATKEYETRREDVTFLVIHYGKKYNPQRTIKNFLLIKENFKFKIDFKVLSRKAFTDWATLLEHLDEKRESEIKGFVIGDQVALYQRRVYANIRKIG